MVNKIYQGDCMEVMKDFPDESIDMCFTSPPYWGLRDYEVEQIFGGDKDCEHEWRGYTREKNTWGTPGQGKHGTGDNYNTSWVKEQKQAYCRKCGAWKGQLGLEPTPEMYVQHMTEIFHEVKRVLKKTGTLWIVIGDTYVSTPAGNPGCHGLGNRDKSASADHSQRMDTSKIGLPSKCLVMIPERLALSMIQDDWILRNKIIWSKPNAMPSSVKDRFNNKWEYILMFSKSQKYFFDLDAVREPHQYDGRKDTKYKGGAKDIPIGTHERWPNQLGKNPGDVFESEDIIAGELAYKINLFEEAHPEMDAGWFSDLIGDIVRAKFNPGDVLKVNTQPFPAAHFAVFPEKLCEKPIKAGCPEGGILLDPFCGSGTALYVAQEMKRNFIGIDISEKYCEMARKRVAQKIL